MMETDDKLIKSFFENNRKEIKDQGFTQKVIKQLPKKPNLLGKIIIIIATLVALIFFIAYDGFLGVIYLLRDLYVFLAQNTTIYSDPKTIIIAILVLCILGIRKVFSMV